MAGSDHRPHPNLTPTRELVNQGLINCNILATQKLTNIKKKKKKKSKNDFRVLTILDKLQSTIRYQLPWLKIYNIWLLLSSLFFNVSSAMCGRNQCGGFLYLRIPTLWQFFFWWPKKGGEVTIMTHSYSVTIDISVLENVGLSYNYCGRKWPQTSP